MYRLLLGTEEQRDKLHNSGLSGSITCQTRNYTHRHRCSMNDLMPQFASVFEQDEMVEEAAGVLS